MYTKSLLVVAALLPFLNAAPVAVNKLSPSELYGITSDLYSRLALEAREDAPVPLYGPLSDL